ncbi:hypothetical protein NP493_413g01042 [Ridgeia piscesae]|uniref:Uncharacterized protein n=1 Tax=Ridgeia piscesae TaxID=27915 RepID=A0AAD9NSF1_RIDPI|nr:hypothetical protein NP493_413g01042 [Ridgeia piscesae]
MDTGEGILDSPREYTTDGEVSVLDLTEMEGVSLDDLADMEGVPLSDPEDEGADEEGIYYDEEEDVYWMDVVMDMTSDDERFGFSVMGGVEEGFLPRVDEISIGRSCY